MEPIRVFVIVLATEHARYARFTEALGSNHTVINATIGRSAGCVPHKLSKCSKIRGIIDTHTSFVRSDAAEQLGESEPYVFAEVDAHALPLWQQKLSRITSKTAADVVGLACQKGNVCKGTTALLLKNLTVHRKLVKMFGVRPFNDIDCVMFRTVVLLDIQCSPFPLFQQRKGRW